MSEPPPQATSFSKWLAIAGILAAVATIAAAALFITHSIRRDASILFLIDEGGAKWLRFDDPVTVNLKYDGLYQSGFAKSFRISEPVTKAVLHVRFMKYGSVLIDGQTIWESQPDKNWKTTHAIDITKYVSPGDHTVLLLAKNDTGRPCVIAYCPEIGLATGAGWQTTEDGKTLTPAWLASDPHPIDLNAAYERADRAFLRLLPLYIAIVALVFLVFRWGDKVFPERLRSITPSTVRWIIMATLFVLGLNNATKLGPLQGFDQRGHFEYIERLANTGTIPLASDGWQMFQSPLYYLLNLPLYFLFFHVFEGENFARVFRIIPILCSLWQVDTCFRVGRHLYPERRDLQLVTTFLGGLMPMNIYYSQHSGNEPLASALIAFAVLICIRAIQQPLDAPRTGLALQLGLVMGLALLTKFTAILLVPITAFAIILWSARGEQRFVGFTKNALLRTTAVWGIAFAICGWYYMRNWQLLGKPFVGGWEAARGMAWWQDPGYRTLAQFTSFGAVFTHPIYSCVDSALDGIYSTMFGDGMLSSMGSVAEAPRWNYTIMLSAMWLSILPAAAITLGIVRSLGGLRAPAQSALLFSSACVAAFLAALLLHTIENPALCAAKAFYTLGALPCYAVLGAAGIEWLTPWKQMRPVAYGLLACWCVASYAAYFIL
jgi:hypothetical protein